MKTYEYKGFDHAGHATHGLIEALSPKDAREKLAHQGILPKKVAPAGVKSGRFSWFKKDRFGPSTRALFYREMCHLTRAGLPLAEALQILIQSPEMGENRPLLAGIRDDLHEGSTLAEALVAQSSAVGSFEESIIEAGERSGALAEIFERLAVFLEEEQMLREKLTTLMIYPAFLMIISFMVGIVIFGVLLPSFSTLLTEANIPFPPITQWTLNLGEVMSALALPAVLVAGLLIVLARGYLKQHEEARLKLDRLYFRLPLIGHAYTALVNLRFSRTFALLLEGGVSLIASMKLSGRASGSLWVTQRVEEESDAVRQGESLADALTRVEPLSGSLPGWVRAGEAGGKLPELLENAGNRFQQQWDRTLSRCLTVIEPALILIVGGFVLLLALAIIMPVMSLNQTLM